MFHTHTKNIVKRMMDLSLLASLAFIALLCLGQTNAALAQTAPPLGAAATFAVLGGSTVTNTGPSIVVGNVGVAPGSAITGFPPGTVTGGTIQTPSTGGTESPAAHSDATTAYNDLKAEPCNTNLTGDDLGALAPLAPGVYCFNSSAGLTGTLHLTAAGNTNPVWVFQMGTTLTTASNSSVVFNDVGQGGDVFWQVGSSATLGTGTVFEGTIIAEASITLNTGASLSGRALALTGAVTMDDNSVTVSLPPPPTAPTLGKAFNPATIDAGGISLLTITLSNANSTAANLSAPLIDTLPSGVVIANPTNANNTCGGVVTATAGGTAVTLTGGSIPANNSCTVTVDVTAPLGGNYINSLPAGALHTSNGNNAAPAAATLTVITLVVPPTLGKAFNPATINATASSLLTITLSNANSTAATLSAPLIDTLPSGVVIANPANANNTCGGVVTATAGGTTVTLTGGSIPANNSCTVTADVTAPLGGNYINTLLTGALQTSNGNNAAPAVATLTVIPPPVAPTLGKAFNPATIDATASSILTITLSNANTKTATLTAPLIDTLPSGVVIANPPVAGTTCGGGTTVTATAGGTTVTLPTGRSIPANNSCKVTVHVTAPLGGNYINTLAAGALHTSNGNNAAPAVATLTVIPPPVAPTLGKAFNLATIDAGGISLLTITLSNANSTAATLSAPLIDTLPGGVFIANPANAATTCSGTGAVSASAGGSTVTLPAGRSIPANNSCTVTVDVTAPLGGNYINTLLAGALQTSNGNNAAPAAATLTVITPAVPITLTKGFSPNPIPSGKGGNLKGVSTLTITLTNANSAAATLTAPLIDTLPRGVVIANPLKAGTTCGGGTTVTATAGGTTVTLPAGRSIPGNSSCTVNVQVTAICDGAYVNTLLPGALQTNKGFNDTPASATLSVVK